MTQQIGIWDEAKTRNLTEHTSYAADYIHHKTKQGKYPARLSFKGGYTIPMPEWLLVGIDSEVVDGKYYNGCGGMNYGYSEAEKGPSIYHVQMNAYSIKILVDDGVLSLLPEWEFLNQDWQLVLDYIRENGLPNN